MTIQGKSVYSGVAIGRLAIYQKSENQVKREKITDTAKEIKRFEDARETAKQQLAGLYEKALKEVGEVNAAIFEVHQMMLEDLDYVESITNMIEGQQVNAEYAVASTGDTFSEMFAAMDDDYMRERSADVRDVSNRVVSILQGNGGNGLDADEPVILLADDLAPSETVQLDKSKVLSFVTRHGSTNSHTAILASTMNIPALIGVDFPEDVNGKMGIVDGYEGKIIIDPPVSVMEAYQKKKQRTKKRSVCCRSSKAKKTSQRMEQKLTCMPTLEALGMWHRYWQMMPAASDCSEANSFIWRAGIIQPRKNSLQHTAR